MGEINKLIETLRTALEKTGGEAARVWPDLVAQKAFGAFLVLWTTGIFGVLLFTATIVLWLRALKMQKERDYDAGAIFGVGFVPLAVAFVLLTIAGYNLSIYYYPEAALVRELLGK